MTYHTVTYFPTRTSPGVGIKLWARQTDLGSLPNKKGHWSHTSLSLRMTGRCCLPRNAMFSVHTGTFLGYQLHMHQVWTHHLCPPVSTTQGDVTGETNSRSNCSWRLACGRMHRVVAVGVSAGVHTACPTAALVQSSCRPPSSALCTRSPAATTASVCCQSRGSAQPASSWCL